MLNNRFILYFQSATWIYPIDLKMIFLRIQSAVKSQTIYICCGVRYMLFVQKQFSFEAINTI